MDAIIIYPVLLGLGIYLLIGVKKESPKHVKVWVMVKSVLLLLYFVGIIFRLVLLLFGIDSDLDGKITYTVLEGTVILVVYSYYQELKENENPVPVIYE